MSPTEPIIIEIVACLERGEGTSFGFPSGFKAMLVEGVRPLVDDDDFHTVVSGIAQLALALKGDSPGASEVLMSVLRDEVVAGGIKALNLGGSIDDLAATGRSFKDFEGNRESEPVESNEARMSWFDALIATKTK